MWQIKRRRTNRRSSRGFTLVEILIAITLLSTIMAILWGTFANSVRLRDVATERYDRYRNVQAALRRIQSEVSMAFVTKIGQNPTNERGELRYFTAFIGESESLDFANFAHIRTRIDEVASEQAEIGYFLRSNRSEDGRLRQDLMRREQAPIDEEPDEGGNLFTLLEDVYSVEFEYWMPDRDIAGDAWERSWDSRDTGVVGLPPRVRITIEIQDPIRPRQRQTFIAQAEIPLTHPIGFATAGMSSEQLEALEEIENILAEESDDYDEDEAGLN